MIEPISNSHFFAFLPQITVTKPVCPTSVCSQAIDLSNLLIFSLGNLRMDGLTWIGGLNKMTCVSMPVWRLRDRASKYHMTPLDDFYGLLDLPLFENEVGEEFLFRGAQCRLEEVEGHLLFEAVFERRFALALVFPGWFVGEPSNQPVHIAVIGEVIAMIAWLPVAREDKLELIRRLPFDEEDKCLMRIAA